MEFERFDLSKEMKKKVDEVEKYLEENKLFDALKGAEFLVEPYKTQELKKVEDKLINEGLLSGAVEAALHMSEPTRTKELVNIVNKYIERGMFISAMDVADYLQEPQRTENIEKIKYYKQKKPTFQNRE